LLINLISSRQCHCFHDRSPPSHAVHPFVHELGEVVTGNAIFGRSAWIAFVPTITAFVAKNHPLYKRLIVCNSHGLHQCDSLPVEAVLTIFHQLSSACTKMTARRTKFVSFDPTTVS